MAGRIKSNFMFLVDVSYSMQGCLAYSAIDALKGALKQVKKTDTFNIVMFGTQIGHVFSASREGSRSNKRNAIEFVKNTEYFGGTDLKTAMKYARTLTVNYNPSLYVIISDGEFSI